MPNLGLSEGSGSRLSEAQSVPSTFHSDRRGSPEEPDSCSCFTDNNPAMEIRLGSVSWGYSWELNEGL